MKGDQPLIYQGHVFVEANSGVLFTCRQPVGAALYRFSSADYIPSRWLRFASLRFRQDTRLVNIHRQSNSMRSYGGPLDEVSTTPHDEVISTSLHNEVISTSTHDDVISTCPYDEVISTSTYDEVISTSTYEEVISTRSYEEVTSTSP